MLPPALICCEPTLCLLATRISVKLMVMIFVIVGVAAAQLTADVGPNRSLSYTLTTITVESGGVTTTMTLNDAMGEGECGDKFIAMFNAALAMGIISILCAAAGISMAEVNKFLGNRIPALIFAAVAGMEGLTALVAFSLVASALNGGACDDIKMSDIDGSKYGAGFIMLIIGWIISFGDIAVEGLVFLGMLGRSSVDSSQMDSPMMGTVVQANGYKNNNSVFAGL